MLKLLKKVGYWGWWSIAVATTYLLLPHLWGAEDLPFAQRAFWASVLGVVCWSVWTGLDWLQANRPRTSYGVSLGLSYFLIANGVTHIAQGLIGWGVLITVLGVLFNLTLTFSGPPQPSRPDIDASRGLYIEIPEDAPPFVRDGRGRVIPPEQYTLKIVKDPK